jgi:GNAT superfamily N-acetyltransferase
VAGRRALSNPRQPLAKEGPDAMITVRDATEADLDYITELAHKRRVQYAGYQPVFWRPAANARDLHRLFFNAVLSKEGAWLLVAESDGQPVGFALASLVPAPPVYDPGGKVCFIDDYGVEPVELWPTAGRALAEAAFERAKARGASLANIAISPKDEDKLAVIDALGFTIAAEWRVRSL